ncbi:MAG: sel1 repeat family protein [Gammaproteobacteria bacterium]|nr:sel1 repeat family protein [Gammaproteobacteria bacterium]
MNESLIKNDQPIFIILLLLSCISLFASTTAYAISSASSTSLSSSSANSDYKKAYGYETGNRGKKDLKKAIQWYKKAANKSHKKAEYRLGILYYQQKNYEKAKYWLEKRANAGEPDAQYHYANILRFGLGTSQQTSSARKWYSKAAEQGHKQAQYELALMFQKGIGARKNTNTAEKWFKKAAKQNHKQARHALKNLPESEQKPKKSAQELFLEKNKKLAKSGDTEAQFNLAKAYQTGKKAPKNLKESLKWLETAANSNHPDAQYQLASIYLEGNEVVSKNLEKARKWFSEAADNEHKQANKKLDKIASEKHKEQQVEHFDKMIDSALLGDPEQQYELGMRYLLGFKTAPDDQQAHYWLKLAASQNHPRAMYQLGNQYLSGIVVTRDINKAMHYFTAAAKQNIQAAQTAISLYAENGYKDLIDAEKGDKIAQLAIAQSYLEKDTLAEQQTGFEWLKKSAEQSYPPALISLAKIYEAGILAPKSYEKAFLSYQTAANLNDASAQYALGRMYQAGIGTTINRQLAFRWFEKAASQGLREAEQALQFSGL